MDTTPVMELLPEVIEIIILGLGSVGLAMAGIFIERFALLTALGGEGLLGGWFAFMGCMAFLFAYLLVTDKFRPKLVSLWLDLTDA